MRLIGRVEQQAIDRLWQQVTGLPLILLMESASMAVARICRQLIKKSSQAADSRVLVLAGKGQNGGDAFACVRQLMADGVQVTCREVFPDMELPPEAALNRQALLSLNMKLGFPQDGDFTYLGQGDLIVDGIFGTGFKAGRPLPPPAAVTIRQIDNARDRGVRVVSIDIPSGVDADSGAHAKGAVMADYTVTFIRSKVGLSAAPGRFRAGHVVVDRIGVSDQIVDAALKQAESQSCRPPCYQIEKSDILALRPKRQPDSHKGLYGSVLLLGGAAGMPGAILLAAEAAARSGTGLVYLGVPESVAPQVLSARPECLLDSLPENPYNPSVYQAKIEKLMTGRTVVAAGPGAGAAGWLAETLPLLIRQANQLVLDADALNLVSTSPDPFMEQLRDRVLKLGLSPAVLTPHPGEFRRLAPDIDLQDRQMAALKLAERSQCVIVLKGASTVVAEPGGDIRINPTGHDGLARGGSGDVLCGLITGLLGQGLSPGKAAVAGVYLHGLAADLAGARLSHRTMLPSDVISSLGDAFRACGWEPDEEISMINSGEDI